VAQPDGAGMMQRWE